MAELHFGHVTEVPAFLKKSVKVNVAAMPAEARPVERWVMHSPHGGSAQYERKRNPT